MLRKLVKRYFPHTVFKNAISTANFFLILFPEVQEVFKRISLAFVSFFFLHFSATWKEQGWFNTVNPFQDLSCKLKQFQKVHFLIIQSGLFL